MEGALFPFVRIPAIPQPRRAVTSQHTAKKGGRNWKRNSQPAEPTPEQKSEVVLRRVNHPNKNHQNSSSKKAETLPEPLGGTHTMLDVESKKLEGGRHKNSDSATSQDGTVGTVLKPEVYTHAVHRFQDETEHSTKGHQEVGPNLNFCCLRKWPPKSPWSH